MEMELEKVPNTQGAPGAINCSRHTPASTSARICASVPAAVTGDMAPERMNGETMQAWLLRA